MFTFVLNLLEAFFLKPTQKIQNQKHLLSLLNFLQTRQFFALFHSFFQGNCAKTKGIKFADSSLNGFQYTRPNAYGQRQTMDKKKEQFSKNIWNGILLKVYRKQADRLQKVWHLVSFGHYFQSSSSDWKAYQRNIVWQQAGN